MREQLSRVEGALASYSVRRRIRLEREEARRERAELEARGLAEAKRYVARTTNRGESA